MTTLAPDNIFKEAANAIASLIFGTNKQLETVITMLKTPTPIKVTQNLLVDPSGCIGGGLSSPDPKLLYACPSSAEAWLHRITITAPDYGPAAPLTQGQLLCTGSTSGEILFFLPYHGDVAPIQIVEGLASAPHLNNGERALIVADQLPPGIHIRIDLQISIVIGVSTYTPRESSPTNLDKSKSSISVLS
jgi:hypothetical protein